MLRIFCFALLKKLYPVRQRQWQIFSGGAMGQNKNRQGCISSLSFNIYSEEMFWKALEETSENIKIKAEKIDNVSYAHHTVNE